MMHKAFEFINYFFFWGGGAKTSLRGITVRFNFCSCFSVFVKIQSSVSCYSSCIPASGTAHVQISPGSQQQKHCTTGMNLSFSEAPAPYLSEQPVQNSSDFQMFCDAHSFHYCQFSRLHHESLGAGFASWWKSSVITPCSCMGENPAWVGSYSCFLLLGRAGSALTFPGELKGNVIWERGQEGKNPTL